MTKYVQIKSLKSILIANKGLQKKKTEKETRKHFTYIASQSYAKSQRQ